MHEHLIANVLHVPEQVIYSPVQIEQEIGLIVDKKDIRAAFEACWTTSYVSALLKYGERSKKKTIKDICTKLVESGVCINTCACKI